MERPAAGRWDPAGYERNARFVSEVAQDHGGFGRFLASWPADDQIGLMALLRARGARLGGATGQFFLRFVGYDGFITSNMAIVPTTNGSIDAYAAALTQLILDISGYFAP